MVPEVLEYIEEYMSKGLEYAKTIDKECESKINFYFTIVIIMKTIAKKQLIIEINPVQRIQ